MTDETVLIDVAWTKPSPAAVKAAGYHGVIGYISHDPAKDLGAKQAKTYLRAGLCVGLVFETLANEAEHGAAQGAVDRKYAEGRAKAMGYPKDCPLFYAVDEDVDPAKVADYFRGVMNGATWPSGPYGSARVVTGVLTRHPHAVAWQTVAWSGGVLAPSASIYQRNMKTRPKIRGVAGNSYDEDVILKPIKLWGGVLAPPHAKPVKKPKPKPHPTPTPAPHGGWWGWFRRWIKGHRK